MNECFIANRHADTQTHRQTDGQASHTDTDADARKDKALDCRNTRFIIHTYDADATQLNRTALS